MTILVRFATKDERRVYCCQIGDSLIVAVDETGCKLGYCEYKDDTIFVIESFVRGTGRVLVEFLPQCVYADYVLLGAYGFWQKMGFEPWVDKTWRRMLQ